LKSKNAKHTTAGIRWWSPTQLLICRSGAYVWQSGRDAQVSPVCGRMCRFLSCSGIYASPNFVFKPQSTFQNIQKPLAWDQDALLGLVLWRFRPHATDNLDLTAGITKIRNMRD
ncbi:hypothetical protein DL95DRAFT_282429, partial [Leptodontidium sp. 2 PMI_412]